MKKLCVNEIMNAPAIIHVRRSITTTLVVNAILDEFKFQINTLDSIMEELKWSFNCSIKFYLQANNVFMQNFRLKTSVSSD